MVKGYLIIVATVALMRQTGAMTPILTTTTLAATIVRRRSVVMAFWIQPMVVSENQTVLFVMTATRPVVTVARPVVK